MMVVNDKTMSWSKNSLPYKPQILRYNHVARLLLLSDSAHASTVQKRLNYDTELNKWQNYQNITTLTVTHNISTRTTVAKQTPITRIAQQD